jgi:hypothetical protein
MKRAFLLRLPCAFAMIAATVSAALPAGPEGPIQPSRTTTCSRFPTSWNTWTPSRRRAATTSGTR